MVSAELLVGLAGLSEIASLPPLAFNQALSFLLPALPHHGVYQALRFYHLRPMLPRLQNGA